MFNCNQDMSTRAAGKLKQSIAQPQPDVVLLGISDALPIAEDSPRKCSSLMNPLGHVLL